MVAEFDAFATRMAAPLSGLALLLTGDRDSAATLVHTTLTKAYTDRTPDERRVIAGLVRTWLAGAPPVGEPAELSYDLDLLRRSIDALPEKHRVTVVLHHWSGLAVPEIAGLLRRPERAVAADLEAGEAELHVPAPAEPDEPPPTVPARLAALVAAAGPPLVDLADVGEAGRAQRRQRRRTAIAAAAVLIAAGTVAALLTAGEPEAVTWKASWPNAQLLPTEPVIDDRARRLTAQLTAAMDDVLPGVTDLRPGYSERPPLEFSIRPEFDPTDTYAAEAGFGATVLLFYVESRAADAYVPCAEPNLDCRYRQFPDGTVAEVVVHTEADRTALSLLSRRPDGTSFYVIANAVGAPGTPELSVADMFRFATLFTY
jgi:hypothetical protein